jgi:hypothetical protein
VRGTLPAAWKQRLSIENQARADAIGCRPVNPNALPVPNAGISLERDIRPLFRQIDIHHMNKDKDNVLLDNYT